MANPKARRLNHGDENLELVDSVVHKTSSWLGFAGSLCMFALTSTSRVVVSSSGGSISTEGQLVE